MNTIMIIIGTVLVLYLLYCFIDWVLPDGECREFKIKKKRIRQRRKINGIRREPEFNYYITFREPFRRRRYLQFPYLDEETINDSNGKISWYTSIGPGLFSNLTNEQAIVLLALINNNPSRFR